MNIKSTKNKLFISLKHKRFLTIVFLFLICPLSSFGQTVIGGFTFSELPKDKQLYARDINNKGTVVIEGDYDSLGEPQYDNIQIRVNRNGIQYGSWIDQDLNYTGNTANFNFSIEIDAELVNYTFEVRARLSGTYFLIGVPIDEVVAGDVYIIQGQSNAVARERGSSGSANANQNNFIRVYANGTGSVNDLLGNDTWYEAEGDENSTSNGNTGQWGLKLARLILDAENIPIAIFNGGSGGKPIEYFLENYNDSPQIMNNYERLLYRLDETRLKNDVKAILWSQGETVTNIASVDDYKNDFISLRDSWKSDYPSVEKFYIFQIRTGCASTTSFISLMQTKEAERQLAKDFSDIHIMTTDGLLQYTDTCHFYFTGGYEEFANRIYELIDRDFYGGNDGEIEPPNIIDAYLNDATTLIVETDANELFAGTIDDIFELGNAGNASITNITVLGSQIIFTLSENPGPNSTISNLGSDPGTNTNLITNINDIEVVAFYEFPIDDTRFITIWDGNSWSNNVPDVSKDAIINGDYTASNGNIIANNLTVNTGINLSFVDSNTNSVVVYGDLIIDGTFTIGNQNSLVMYNDDAAISGVITKSENSTSRNNTHDFTYWSSPVINAPITSVFPGVDPNRIFWFDQSQTNVSDPVDSDYYKPWLLASGIMTPGLGYAAEGVINTTGVHFISITGIPNNGEINVPLEGYFGDGNPDNDFNLIGNPYPSAINIDSLFTHNLNLDATAYLWTHFTPISGGTSGDFVSSDYALYNFSGGSNPSGGPDPTNNIGSSQGFFVRAIASGSVNFTNSMRMEDVNDQFYKLDNSKKKHENIENKDRIWLSITTEQGGINQLLVAFTDKASEAVDRGYDALIFKNSANPITFYSLVENDKYTIQGLGTFSDDKRVELGFDTKVAPRNFSISIKKTEGLLIDQDVYLVDHLLNITHDLKSLDYQFQQITTGEYPHRFTLQFSGNALSIDEVTVIENLIVSNVFNGLIVSSNHTVQSIKVYDLLGRLLINEKPMRNSIELKTGSIRTGTILLLKATFENGTVLSKKVIKY